MTTAYTHEIRVRYGEVDLQGVVFNAHWLAYFDDALTRYLLDLGFDVPGDPANEEPDPADVMVVHAELDWHGPAGIGDLVEITIDPVRLGTSSFDLRFTATVAGRDVCSATLTYVSVGSDGRPRPIPDELRGPLSATTS